MAQTKTKSPFAGKAAIKREQSGARTGSAEREQARRGFLGNGLSRTAMLFRIATMAGHRLTVPELNRIRDINPRQLERTYETVEDPRKREVYFSLTNSIVFPRGKYTSAK